jgi:hypothetical protein
MAVAMTISNDRNVLRRGLDLGESRAQGFKILRVEDAIASNMS